MNGLKLYLIGLGNLVDTLATLHLYRTRMFEELNPIMALLLQNPFPFAIIKISVMTLILLRLWQVREDKKSKIAINIGCWIYGLIALYYAILIVLLPPI